MGVIRTASGGVVWEPPPKIVKITKICAPCQATFCLIWTAVPGQEGWTRHQEKYREASFDGADGVVVQIKQKSF